jgi:hypothetical protein
VYFSQSWFKYPSIASCRRLYEKVCTASRHWRHYDINNNHIRKSSGISRAYYNRYSSNGISSFFIKKLIEEPNKERNQRKQQIAEHYNKLILEFSDKLDKVNTSDFTWSSFFESFEYSKEFRQHLLTGHPELSELLNRVIESEKAAELSFKSISEKVRDRIIKKAKELEIPIPKKKNDDPSFNDDYISKVIIEEYNLSSNDNIVYKDTGEHSAELKSKPLNFHSFDYHLAVKFVIKLNEITDDASIHEGIDNYHDIRKTKGENTIKFNELLKDLLHGIFTSAKVLGGACDHCLNLHDKKDTHRLKPLLSQISE